MLTPVVAALVLVASVHWVLPRQWLQARRGHLAEVCQRHRVVAITFDDGPGRVLTPLLSERLAVSGAPATFFLLASNLRGNEDIVEGLVKEGHEIGSHGDRHVHHMWSWPWKGLVDTRNGWRRLGDMTGRPVHGIPYRPPFGKMNVLSMLYVWRKRTPIVLWTIDGFDARLGVDKSPAELAEEVRTAGGGVLLLHDFDRSLPNARQQVVAKLDAVLRMRNDGFRFLRASELMALTDSHAPSIR